MNAMTTTTTTTARPSFRDKLTQRVKETSSLLCIGLDPHEKELIKYLLTSNTEQQQEVEEDRNVFLCKAAYEFCRHLIEATISVAVCYKPNIAFFEALGNGGHECLQSVIQLIPSTIPILLDAKRGDIGTTASAYAVSAFDQYNVDAITLSPLMGYDSIQPFLQGKYSTKGAFLLCKTSNPGSNDLLTQPLQASAESESTPLLLYEKIATLVCNEWSQRVAAESTSTSSAMEDDSKASSSSSTTDKPQTPLLGLVVGATDSIAMQKVRAIINNSMTTTSNDTSTDSVWILAPGVGPQGGSLEDTIRYGINPTTGMGLLLPVSRAISQSSNPAQAAEDLRQQIATIRQQVMSTAAATTTTTLPTPPTSSATNEQQPEPQPKRTTSTDNDDGTQSKDMSSTTSSSTSTTTTTSIKPYQREFLEYSIQSGVLKFGSFLLKSGRTSPYFFNAGLFSTGSALYTLGYAYASAIAESRQFVTEDLEAKFDIIFGPAYKGIPIGAVVCTALYTNYGIDVGYAYNRKEAKDHGEGGTLVGAALQDKRVLIIDDVITAGTAIREVYTLLEAAAAQPVGVIIALDRAEKRSLDDPVSAVQAVARDLSLPVVSIVNLVELQAFIQQRTDLYSEETIQCVIQYRDQYGA